VFVDSYETGDTARRGSPECAQVNDALKALDAGDPTSAIGRYEENIRRKEATVRGQQELAASSLDTQFDSLEDLGEQTEVEARLAALKSMDRKAIDY
jgi:phage shock protein A